MAIHVWPPLVTAIARGVLRGSPTGASPRGPGGISITVTPRSIPSTETGEVTTFRTNLAGPVTWSFYDGHDGNGFASIDPDTGAMSLAAGWVEGDLADIWVQAENATEVRVQSAVLAGLVVAGEQVGIMLDLAPATPAFFRGAFSIPSSAALKCVRASTGSAVGGSASDTFAVDTPRIIGGKIFRDNGGTNPMVAPDDISNAAWTKTGLATVTNVAGEAGATSAKRIAETNTGAAQAHVVQNLVTVPSNTDFFVGKIVGADRGYVQFDLYNSGTTAGVRARFDLTGNGSLISNYPAGLGPEAANVTNIAAGVVKLTSGLFFVWVACTMPSATTLARVSLSHMSNSSTTSYIGDTSKGLTVESAWITPGSRTPVYALGSTARGTEALATAPMPRGAYIEQISDGVVTSLSAFLLSSAANRAITPPSWIPWITRYRLYKADAYDAMDRADTSDGDIGTASDGGTYALFNGYVGSFPLPAATRGKITNNWVAMTPVSGSLGALYLIRDVYGPVKFASMRFRFGPAVSGGEALSNTALALLTTHDITRPVEEMPVHLVANRSGVSIQIRTIADGFVTLGLIGARIPNTNTEHVISFAIHGTTMRVTLDNESVVVEHELLADAGRYICWEYIATSNNTTDNGQFKDAFATRALVGDTPVFVAAAPIVRTPASTLPSSPPTYTAGCTLSVAAQPARVNSNSGNPTITGYQWYRNGVAISGATGATHVTTPGTDAGATFYCAITYTNWTGSTVENSLVTPALLAA